MAEDEFKDSTDEFNFHLVRAEQHAKQAHDLLYESEGPKRSIWYRMRLGRAQNALISLYVRDLNRKKKQ